MTTIGLLGGIASGKSTVAGLFAELGAVVLDADAAAHEVLAEEQVVEELAAAIGDCVVRPDGKVNRKQLAELVFGEADQAEANRKKLEALVHPRTHEKLLRMRSDAASEGKTVFVLDVPLLLEAGWQQDCDLLIFLDAPEEVRQARAAERGWSQEEFSRREAAQLPITDKRAAADEILQSDGSLEELRLQVKAAWNRHVGESA